MDPGETDLNLSGDKTHRHPDHRLTRWRTAALYLKRRYFRAKEAKEEKLHQLRVGEKYTLKDTREAILAAKNARMFRKWENSNSQHEHSQETMAGNDSEETSQCDSHKFVSGYVQSPQSAHLWKNNGFPIQPGASVKEDVVFDIPENEQLPPVSTSNSPVGTLLPGFCQSHMQKDNINSTCPLMLNPDNTMIVSHNIPVYPDGPDTSKEREPGHKTDSGYGQNAESAFESGFSFQQETLGRADVILDIPEKYHIYPVGTSRAACDDHPQSSKLPPYFSKPGHYRLLHMGTSMAARVQPHCSTLPPDSSQSPASLLVAQNGLLELTRPDTSNEMEVESQMYDNDDCTLPLRGNQNALSSNSMIVALNVPLDLNEPNPAHLMETESQVHDNDDPELPLPVNRGSSATRRYFGIEVNVMLAGINGAAIVGLSSFAPKDSSLKHVFAAAVGIGFFGSLFAILCRRKLKQATILSKIGIIGTSSAILVALGTEFGVNFVVIALVCLIFALVMMISD